MLCGAAKEVTLRVGQSCYQPKLKDCCMLSVSVMAQVVETKQIFVQKECTTLTKPGLNVVVSECIVCLVAFQCCKANFLTKEKSRLIVCVYMCCVGVCLCMTSSCFQRRQTVNVFLGTRVWQGGEGDRCGGVLLQPP